MCGKTTMSRRGSNGISLDDARARQRSLLGRSFFSKSFCLSRADPRESDPFWQDRRNRPPRHPRRKAPFGRPRRCRSLVGAIARPHGVETTHGDATVALSSAAHWRLNALRNSSATSLAQRAPAGPARQANLRCLRRSPRRSFPRARNRYTSGRALPSMTSRPDHHLLDAFEAGQIEHRVEQRCLP